MSETPSIHEWIGGTEAIGRWLNAFYDEVERDELLAPVFGGVVSVEHREHVTAWWAEVMGGPADVQRGAGRLRAHAGQAPRAGDHRRAAAAVRDAAERRRPTRPGIPADPEARSALMGYAEWGSRLAVENSAADATPVEHAPVPRWGWGVAPPYQP